MLNFEAIEMIKNKHLRESFNDFIEENPKYSTFLTSLIGKSHSYLSNLQSRLSKSNEYAQGKNADTVKEDKIIKEFSLCFLYLGKYFKSALSIILEENENSSFQKFEISKMLSKTVRAITNLGEMFPDKIKGILFSCNNLGYLHNKLSLLSQTGFFKVSNTVKSQFGDEQDEKRFNSLLENIKEDIPNLMYSLSRLVWQQAS